MPALPLGRTRGLSGLGLTTPAHHLEHGRSETDSPSHDRGGLLERPWSPSAPCFTRRSRPWRRWGSLERHPSSGRRCRRAPRVPGASPPIPQKSVASSALSRCQVGLERGAASRPRRPLGARHLANNESARRNLRAHMLELRLVRLALSLPTCLSRRQDSPVRAEPSFRVRPPPISSSPTATTIQAGPVASELVPRELVRHR